MDVKALSLLIVATLEWSGEAHKPKASLGFLLFVSYLQIKPGINKINKKAMALYFSFFVQLWAQRKQSLLWRPRVTSQKIMLQKVTGIGHIWLSEWILNGGFLSYSSKQDCVNEML